MQWMPGNGGDSFDGNASSKESFARQLRLAWIKSLVNSGQYDCPEVWSQTLDQVLSAECE